MYNLAANIETPGAILNSVDNENMSFLDTLIAKEQKITISQHVVQQYLQEIWHGGLQLKAWQFLLFFAAFVLFPPLWFVMSMPVEKGLNKVPVVKVKYRSWNSGKGKISRLFDLEMNLARS